MIQIKFISVYDPYHQFDDVINKTLEELEEQDCSIRAVRFVTPNKCAIEYAVPYAKAKENPDAEG